jgi:hypothetical protein
VRARRTKGWGATPSQDDNSTHAIVARRCPHAAEKRGRRELSDAAILDQARALVDHVARGGAASRWLGSKGFSTADRGRVRLFAARVLAQLARRLAEPVPGASFDPYQSDIVDLAVDAEDRT